MRVGLCSDIHGNRIALDAVLEDLPDDVETLLCAGDVVGYNPWPAECVEIIRERAIPTVAGNHDRMVVSDHNFIGNRMAAAGVDLAREQLDEDALAWLEGLPAERMVLDDRIHIVHGHPDDPDRYTYPDQFEAALLDDEEILVMGHTHVQHHETYDTGVVINPGSVGQPRDEDPRAAYAIVDLASHEVEERRVPYDIEAVVEAVETAGLPPDTGQRLHLGR
jgi:putative phosphoesterase